MSSQMKGLVSVVIAVLAIFSNVTVEILGLTPYVLFVKIIPIVVGILAIYLGILARKGGARLWGLTGIVLGIVATVAHIFWILEKVLFV